MKLTKNKLKQLINEVITEQVSPRVFAITDKASMAKHLPAINKLIDAGQPFKLVGPPDAIEKLGDLYKKRGGKEAGMTEVLGIGKSIKAIGKVINSFGNLPPATQLAIVGAGVASVAAAFYFADRMADKLKGPPPYTFDINYGSAVVKDKEGNVRKKTRIAELTFSPDASVVRDKTSKTDMSALDAVGATDMKAIAEIKMKNMEDNLETGIKRVAGVLIGGAMGCFVGPAGAIVGAGAGLAFANRNIAKKCSAIESEAVQMLKTAKSTEKAIVMSIVEAISDSVPTTDKEKYEQKAKATISKVVSSAIDRAKRNGVDLGNIYFERARFRKAAKETGLNSILVIDIIEALEAAGASMDVSKPSDVGPAIDRQDVASLANKASKASLGTSAMGEVKVRDSVRHSLAPIAGGAIGVALGSFLPIVGQAAGATLGLAAGSVGNKMYDNYLLKKIATEDDIVAAAITSRDLSEDEAWSVTDWLDDSLRSLTDKQRESVVYEDAEFVESGRKYSEPEIASEISDHFSSLGMLDTEQRQFGPPKDEPAQIEMSDDLYDDEAMVAESLRFKKLAGILKG